MAVCLVLGASFVMSARAAGAGLDWMPGSTQRAATADVGDPAQLCIKAVRDAERYYGLPTGLLIAISQVETGRPDASTHRLRPWPWTIQAESRSLYFGSKAEAVEWVHQAQSRGVDSIDTGCLQINLRFHPHAFQTVDQAFDPKSNADYAARFLLALHASDGNWQAATGRYHSQTATLAGPYRERVMQELDGVAPGDITVRPMPPPSTLAMLSDAWSATIETAATND